ncbi:MAG: DHA2 family efflux MFS transporter permease subunit [Candidatus Tectomicrobia bacterium]|nr:DHA2 family efflux MFS transporter permease subunit [Candidatus Tectomicrobia bacterium]
MAEATTLSYLGVRERWLTTGLLGIGLIVFAIGASVSNFSLPKIMTNLRVELYQIHWVLTAFGIARTVIIPTLGWLSGRMGPRLLYLISLTTFCLGSLGSALAWDWGSLLMFRVLTGIGGGLIQPLTMAIFYQIFPPSQRGMALGFSLMGWSIGPTVGSFMAGYVLEFASWRTAFAMVVPLGGIGVVLAWWLLPPLQRPERRRLDHYGLLTMGIAVTTLMLALSQGNREGWGSQYILTLLAIAGGSALVFVLLELWQDEPVVELRLFRFTPFVMASVVLFLSAVAFRGTGPMMQVLMQRLLGFAPLLVAWTQLPGNLVYGFAVLGGGRLADRIAPQLLVTFGMSIFAAVFWFYAGINELATAGVVMVMISLRFLGEGSMDSANNLTALRALPENQVMMAAGLMGLLRSIAGTVGPAFSAVFWDYRYSYHIQKYAERTPVDAQGLTATLSEVQHFLLWTGEIAIQIPTKALSLVHQRLLAEASTAAWHDYFLVNTLIALLCIVPAFLSDRRLWNWRRARQSAPVPGTTSTPGTSTTGVTNR